MRRRFGCALLAVAAFALGSASPAVAGYVIPIRVKSDALPKGYQVRPSEAVSIANRSAAVQRERLRGRLRAEVARVPGGWQVAYVRANKGVALAKVDAVHPRLVGPVWTGPYVQWPVARGVQSAERTRLMVGIVLLSILFVAPFLDARHPWSLGNLDMLAFAFFGAGLAFFIFGRLNTAVALQYPPLLYLLGRFLWLGLRPDTDARGPRIANWASDRVLAVGLVALVVARAVASALWADVGDVGYAGQFGADSLLHGWQLYTVNPAHLDTYGPINYLLYVPFEALFPLGPGWTKNGMVAARLLTLVMDLGVIVLLVSLGRRLVPGPRGRRVGLALGYAWAALPTMFAALIASTNDPIVSAFVLAALALASAPLAAAVILGLGGAAKFSPLALVPLVARRLPAARGRFIPTVALGAIAFLIPWLPYIRQSGFETVWRATLGFQFERSSPFTLWGLHPSLGWIHPIALLLCGTVLVAAVLGRRTRSLPQIAALAAAIIIAVQLAANYWAFTYVPWFAAPGLLALFTAGSPGSEPIASSSGRDRLAAVALDERMARHHHVNG